MGTAHKRICQNFRRVGSAHRKSYASSVVSISSRNDWRCKIECAGIGKTKHCQLLMPCDAYGWRNYVITSWNGRQQWTSGIQIENLTSSEKIVVHILHRSDLLGVVLQLTIDNWFNSIRLNEFLLDHNTLSLGTIRVNRGVPSELVNHPMTPILSHQNLHVRTIY